MSQFSFAKTSNHKDIKGLRSHCRVGDYLYYVELNLRQIVFHCSLDWHLQLWIGSVLKLEVKSSAAKASVVSKKPFVTLVVLLNEAVASTLPPEYFSISDYDKKIVLALW